MSWGTGSVIIHLKRLQEKASPALLIRSDLSGHGQVALEGPPGLGPQPLSLPEFPTGMGVWSVFEVRSKLRGSLSCGICGVAAHQRSQQTPRQPQAERCCSHHLSAVLMLRFISGRDICSPCIPATPPAPHLTGSCYVSSGVRPRSIAAFPSRPSAASSEITWITRAY